MGTTVRTGAVILTVLGLVFAGIVPAAGATGPQADTPTRQPTTDGPPPDPASDRLGWEDGYWYNESIDVNQSDGVSRAELEVTLSRTMARVEQIRRLEFKQRPNVTFLTEEEYKQILAEFREQTLNVTENDRAHQNVKFEALFLVDEDTDYFQVQAANSRTNIPLAFTVTGNSPILEERGLETGDVAIIRRGGEIPKIEETTLAHELVHVLQTQYYNTTKPATRRTEDASLAFDGIIEGDATFLDTQYGERCSAAWDCLSTPEQGPSAVANLGLVLYRQTMYAEGPGLVESIFNEDGWDGVARLYETPPKTTEQLIHPETYPDDTGREVSVPDRSSDAWQIPDLEGGVDYATFGEAGIFMLLYYPSYQSRSEVVMTPNYPFQNTGPGFYNFEHPASSGWDGDKLYPYVSETAAENETGYVWKTAWDSPKDAREFADAYRQVLDYYNARPVQGAEDAYVIQSEKGTRNFSDAFALIVEDDTVTIVNAPTVSALNEVRADTVPADARPPTPTPTETPFNYESSPTASPTPSPTATETPTASSGQPGFGAATAVAALLALVVAAVRRQ